MNVNHLYRMKNRGMKKPKSVDSTPPRIFLIDSPSSTTLYDIIYNPIANCISQCRITNLFIPSTHLKLENKK